MVNTCLGSQIVNTSDGPVVRPYSTIPKYSTGGDFHRSDGLLQWVGSTILGVLLLKVPCYSNSKGLRHLQSKILEVFTHKFKIWVPSCLLLHCKSWKKNCRSLKLRLMALLAFRFRECACFVHALGGKPFFLLALLHLAACTLLLPKKGVT